MNANKLHEREKIFVFFLLIMWRLVISENTKKMERGILYFDTEIHG